MCKEQFYEEMEALAEEICKLCKLTIKDITGCSTSGKVGDETGCPISFADARKPFYAINALALRISASAFGMKEAAE